MRLSVNYTFNKPAGPLQKPNILWYAQSSQWVQNFIFPNEKFIFQIYLFIYFFGENSSS